MGGIGEAALSFSLHTTHREPLTVIGLARLFCYRGTAFQLVEVPPKKAKAERQKLAKDGWVVAYTEVI